MKKVIKNKVFIVIILIFAMLFLTYTPVLAYESVDESGGSSQTSLLTILQAAKSFLTKGASSSEKTDQQTIQTTSGIITQILLVGAVIVAVIVGIIMGIKFITGSIEEQAKIKESIIPYIIGCVVVFAGFTIWKVLVNILQDVT